VQGAESQLMYHEVEPQAVKSIGPDDINGIQYLYNPNTGLHQTAAYEYWTFFGNQYTFNNTHAGVGYKGAGWWRGIYCCSLATSLDLAWSNQVGATSWIAFHGSRITWQFTKHGNRGWHDIYIDGNHMGAIDSEDNSNTLWRVQKTWDLTPGYHIIEVRGRGGDPVDDYSDLDAFILDINRQTGNHDDLSGYISYLGNWTDNSICCPGAWNGTLTWSNTPNNAVVFTFVGDGIKYVFTKAYNRGKVKVTIDGNYIETIDLYAPTVSPNHLWQQEKHYPLSYGTHTIHLNVTGAKHPAAADYYVDVDRFVVD
jgi:hypothetical protein